MHDPRIAILEDCPELREELQLFLHAKGLETWVAGSAEIFWKELHQQAADIVIVDIGLPGEDGFSVIEFLRRLNRDYGLIVITAHSNVADRQRGIALGADFYLIKPVNFADLFEKISALWERIQTTRNSLEATAARPATRGPAWQLTSMGLHDPSGKCLPLTPREHHLMRVLYQRRNEVCSKKLLHELLFGNNYAADSHRIDVIVSRLRSKARRLGIPLDIRSIFGHGITFLDQPTE